MVNLDCRIATVIIVVAIVSCDGLLLRINSDSPRYVSGVPHGNRLTLLRALYQTLIADNQVMGLDNSIESQHPQDTPGGKQTILEEIYDLPVKRTLSLFTRWKAFQESKPRMKSLVAFPANSELISAEPRSGGGNRALRPVGQPLRWG